MEKEIPLAAGLKACKEVDIEYSVLTEMDTSELSLNPDLSHFIVDVNNVRSKTLSPPEYSSIYEKNNADESTQEALCAELGRHYIFMGIWPVSSYYGESYSVIVPFNQIRRRIESFYNVTWVEIRSQRIKSRHVVEAGRLLMWLARQDLNESVRNISKRLDRNESNVIRGIRQISKLKINNNPRIMRAIAFARGS